MSDQQEEFDKYGRRIRGRKSPQNTQPEFDKYGRILGTVFNKKTSENINTKMIDNGYGLPYDGGTKKEFNFSE